MIAYYRHPATGIDAHLEVVEVDGGWVCRSTVTAPGGQPVPVDGKTRADAYDAIVDLEDMARGLVEANWVGAATDTPTAA